MNEKAYLLGFFSGFVKNKSRGSWKISWSSFATAKASQNFASIAFKHSFNLTNGLLGTWITGRANWECNQVVGHLIRTTSPSCCAGGDSEWRPLRIGLYSIITSIETTNSQTSSGTTKSVPAVILVNPVHYTWAWRAKQVCYGRRDDFHLFHLAFFQLSKTRIFSEIVLMPRDFIHVVWLSAWGFSYRIAFPFKFLHVSYFPT